MVWNLGLIIDYVLHDGQSYFKSVEDIKKFSGNFLFYF